MPASEPMAAIAPSLVSSASHCALASSVGALQSNTPTSALSQKGCQSRANASLSGLFLSVVQPAHLKPVVCGVKQLSKRPLVGLFL